MTTIPQDSASLIKALDEQECGPQVQHVQNFLTEESRLELARQLGRRELVNELIAILAREAE